jgi:diguanylate cyclase (GGDEF)-like protein
MQSEAGPAETMGAGSVADTDRQICCSMTGALLSVVREDGGDAAVASLLGRAGTNRDLSYLENPDNWISLAEATALLAAGVAESGDQAFARRVGEHTVRRHAGTQVSTILRSLGSTEAVLEQITRTTAKLSAVTDLETLEARPGHAVVRARARPGFERTRLHCDWAAGLISSSPILFGLPPARVSESECQARGDASCLYEVSWDAELAAQAADPQLRVTALEAQMIAMSARLKSCFATAGDLVSASDLRTVLQRIVERAATAVRAPSRVLAVRTEEAAELEVYCHGIDADTGEALARASLEGGPMSGTALAVEVRSSRRSYGRLIAHYPTSMEFFPQEEELLRLYAQHAAAVLDMATALDDSDKRHREVSALHSLALALAEAGTSDEVAQRLAASVPEVVDCDRVSVWLWDGVDERLRMQARAGGPDQLLSHLQGMTISPADTPSLERMIAAPEPMFFHAGERDPYIAELMETLGVIAMVVVPILARGDFLGVLTVSVSEHPKRLDPTRELLAQLTGVAALAATALKNGQLVDTLAFRANHDGLTGLLNRVGFRQRIDSIFATAESRDARMGLLFVDLNGFKDINDLYGHDAGDELIREVARRLHATTRAEDSIARFGGDEFAIILTDISSRDQLRAAEERVRAVFPEAFRLGEVPVSIEASVGSALFPEDGSTMAELVRHADAAMYVDKAKARSAREEKREPQPPSAVRARAARGPARTGSRRPAAASKSPAS